VLDFALTTWNCFGLPQNLLAWVGGDGPPEAHRLDHPELQTAISDHEIVCMQELWLMHANGLFARLPHLHKIRDHNRLSLWPPTALGAGLGIASRFRLTTSALHPFARPYAGLDRLARKGMLHARLALSESPLVEIDLVTTHWQAGESAAALRVRERQRRELTALVREANGAGRACFVCGDFNVDGLGLRAAQDSGYRELREALDGFADLGAADDRPTFHPLRNALARRELSPEPDQRIDYIFFRPARTGPRLEILALKVTLDEPLPASAAGPSTFASDHYALTASCRLD
jgi:endonuclease/exonuclease/phosphatase family metal-dependent hydrolase